MRLVFTVVLCSVYASATLAQDKKHSEQQRILGEWIVVSMKAARGEIPSEQAKKVKLTFTKNQVTFAPWFAVKVEQKGVIVGKRGERQVTLIFRGRERSAYQLDSTTKPCKLDFLDDKGNAVGYKGIYEIEGDTLKLFIDAKRPKHLSSEGSSASFFFEAKRATAKKS